MPCKPKCGSPGNGCRPCTGGGGGCGCGPCSRRCGPSCSPCGSCQAPCGIVSYRLTSGPCGPILPRLDNCGCCASGCPPFYFASDRCACCRERSCFGPSY